MKKVLFVLLALVFSISLMACNRDRTSETGARIVEWYELSEDVEFDDSQDYTVTFWHAMGEINQTLLQTWIDDFEALYPNIDVVEVATSVGDYTGLANAVSLSIAAGDEPDIVQSYPDHVARYASANAPLALNDFISNPNFGFTEAEQADFLPGLWAEGSSYDLEGTFLSLPFTKSSEAFFYRVDYFEEKGYDVPTTWDEVFEIAEQIKEDEPTAIPFGYDSDENLFITASEQYPAAYTGLSKTTNEETGVETLKGEVLFNNEDSYEMAEYFKDKVDRGLMATRTLSGAYASDAMKAGDTTYMYVGSTGGTKYAYDGMADDDVFYEDGYRVGVSTVPAFSDDNKAQIQQGPNINLFRKDDEQQMIASWLFAKYLVSPEVTAELGVKTGYAPVRTSAYETDIWTDYVAGIETNPTTMEDAIAKLIKESIELFENNGEIFFTSAVFNLSSKTRSEVGNLLVKILTYKPVGDDDAAKAADLRNYIEEQYQESYDFITN